MLPRLEEFYRKNRAYYEMTDTGGKAGEPQARLLSCLIRPGGRYAEIGCGSGSMCRMVAECATVCGYDVSPIAIARAKESNTISRTSFECAAADALPAQGNSFDGCFSFEVLEHVWDPIAAVREMVRVTKPGGFILISTPNRFSLDLHLPKARIARMVETVVAAARYSFDAVSGRTHTNVQPDLGGDLYADCDMITSIIPQNFCRALRKMGCTVDFVDTTYMCAHGGHRNTTLAFQRNTARPFFRHFGDHLLVLAHKNAGNVQRNAF